MGFIEDKTDLFNEVSAVKALEENFPELNKAINNFNSVKSNSGNIISFLLDLLKSLIDEEAIKEAFIGILSQVDSFEEQIKSVIAQTIIDTYTRNFDFQMPSGTIFSTQVANLDVKDTLKVDPNSQLGKYSYGQSSNVDFTRFLHETTVSGSGSWGGILDVNYASGTIDVSLNSSFANKTFEDFVFDFINSIKILDTGVLMSTILDTLFGSISSLSDAGEQWLREQLELGEIVDKLITTESLSSGSFTYDNSFFEFSKEQINSISAKMEGRANGAHLSDLGCGFGESFIDLDSFDEIFDQLNDIRPTLVKEATTNFTNTLVSQSTVGVSDENRKNVEFNIFKELFENLPNIFTGMVISPAITTMFQVAESIINGSALDLAVTSLTQSPIISLLQQLRDSMSCIVKLIYSLIIEYLYDIAKAEILKLVAVLVAKISTEQLENYQKILQTAREILSQINNVFSLITGE